jgi:hypothetical protein
MFHTCCKLQVFYSDVACVSHICFKCMFSNVSSASDVYVAFKCFMLQVFYISEVCSESHGGTARTPVDRARQAGCPRMGRRGPAVRDTWRAWGSADGDVLVPIPAFRSRPCGEKRAASLGRSHRRSDKGGGARTGIARRTGWAARTSRHTRSSGRPGTNHVLLNITVGYDL